MNIEQIKSEFYFFQSIIFCTAFIVSCKMTEQQWKYPKNERNWMNQTSNSSIQQLMCASAFYIFLFWFQISIKLSHNTQTNKMILIFSFLFVNKIFVVLFIYYRFKCQPSPHLTVHTKLGNHSCNHWIFIISKIIKTKHRINIFIHFNLNIIEILFSK